MVNKYFRENWLKYISLVFIVIFIAVPRALKLNQFVTPDEPRWLTRSANFFLALSQNDFENTYQKEHPGVTIMWAGTAGFLWRYPQYIAQRGGQQDKPQVFWRFLYNRNIQAIYMLEAGRLFVVAAIVLTLALAYWAAIQLLGLKTAFVGFVLIAFDPFNIALSRLLHLDGLLSALMLLSLLTMMNYYYRGHHRANLILSSISAGLGWLTKSPALFLLPFIGLLALLEIVAIWRRKGNLHRSEIWAATWPILFWLFLAILVFVAFFPAMWVKPVQTLVDIFTQVFLYAAEGHGSATFFDSQVFQNELNDWRFYPLSYLWRSTPVVLIGLFLLVLAFFVRNRITFPKEQQQSALILALFVCLYTIFMTIGAKKFDRYLLPVFAPLDLLSALGWVTILLNLFTRIFAIQSGQKNLYLTRLGSIALFGIIMIWQTWGTMQTFPYYLSYYNPLMGGSSKAPQVMMIGWGEGLDEAARYLNAKTDAEKLFVTSWYPDGPFSYFFQGTTIQKDFPPNPLALSRADYVVTYIHQWQRQRPSPEFLEYFDQRQPEHTIWINGIPYAKIYHMD